jgi:diguanylate cyclase (GGDEF)-like protein
VQQQVRDADVVARLGGDEFCVVAEVEHAAQALLIRDRLRTALSQPVECNGNRLLATASVGVAVLSPDTGNLQQLLRAADRDMYAAKEERHSLRPPV